MQGPPTAEKANKGKSKKTEKVLVFAAIFLLLLSVGSLYFDDWLWSGLRSRDKVIGMIVSRSGDVRLKFDQDVQWQKASQGQALQYNDSIFAGDQSQADLKLGKSDLTVTQNSLVVLRREMDAHFLNLNYGTLFGKVAKNDKIYIDTGTGQSTLLKTNSQAKIVLKKVGTETSLQVLSGTAEVEINGVKKTLKENTEIVLPKALDKPKEKLVENKLDLRFEDPTPSGTFYETQPKTFTFKWSYGNGRAALPSDQFRVEFSKTPGFGTKTLSKLVVGALETQLQAANSNQLYYRVYGPNGEVSPVGNFGYIRMIPPQIVRPAFEAVTKVRYMQSADLAFEVRRDSQHPVVWSQIGTDETFETVMSNESLDQTKWNKKLPAGRYFMRVRSDYGNGKLSDWSKPTPFSIEEQLNPIQVPASQLEQRLVIQNLDYPAHLYVASDSEVRQYLYDKGFGRDLFRDLKPFYDQMSLDFGDGHKPISIRDSSLPVGRLYPTSMRYRYQLLKAGMLPSRWSSPEKLQIQLEPPKETLVEVVKSQIKNDGKVPVRIHYTPLLFAKNYEFQVATNDNFSKAQRYVDANVSKNIKLALKKDYYWRVRALDQNKKPLSGFSEVRKISADEMVNQIRLANQERQQKADREPAQEAAETRGVLQQQHTEYQKDHNFWAWMGTGLNYVNFKQNYDSRGDLDSKSKNDKLGQFLEVGYVSDTGMGGILSYKSTPGQITVSNAAIDKNNYTWTTLSLEGLLLKTAPFRVFGRRLNYGPRLGIQSHTVPYVFLNGSNGLELKENNMLMGSVGLMGEIPSGHWRFHSYMRYQLPISAQSGGAAEFKVKSKVTFDGLVGTSYYFTPSFKTGLFWYGQWLYFDSLYSDGAVVNSGNQSLFYSVMDLRFGFEF